MLRKVHLQGEIANRFGDEFEIDADSFTEVFQCLNGNFPEFRQFLIDCHEKGVGFMCEVQGKALESEKELLLDFKEGDMFISAIPAGSSSGPGKILAALAIVAAIIYAPQLIAYGFSSTTGFTAAGTTAFKIGTFAANNALILGTAAVNLALTGLGQIMAPDPSVDSQQQDESYLFQGTNQEAVEGDPVPVLYGQLRVPGRPISSEVRNTTNIFVNRSSGFTGRDYLDLDIDVPGEGANNNSYYGQTIEYAKP